jgi:hypothetical protein
MWTDLKDMLGKISQPPKDKYCRSALMGCLEESNPQRQKREW